MRHATWSLIAGCALLLAVVGPAIAASNDVEITLYANFETGQESFTATGTFCPAGTATTSDLRIVGGRSGLSFHLSKQLTCDDGSGSLTIRVDASTSYGKPDGDRGGWSVVGGTNDWASAAGGGRLVGDYVPAGVIDHYTGSLTR